MNFNIKIYKSDDKMILKIYNSEIVDCSSSCNILLPPPDSLKLIIDLFLRICESEAVENIVEHSITLEFEDDTIGLISPNGNTFGHYEWYINKFVKHRLVYDLQLGNSAKRNKTFGIYISRIHDIEEHTHHHRAGYANTLYSIPAGIKGIRKSVEVVKSLLSNNTSNLPTFLYQKTLQNFEISAKIIWKVWSLYKKISEIGQVQCGEVDSISGSTREMNLYLGNICLGGHQGRPQGDKHFADIQNVLNEYYPEYTIQEVGESATDTNGRKALYKNTPVNEVARVEPSNMYYRQKVDTKEKELLIQIQKKTGKLFPMTEHWSHGFSVIEGNVEGINLTKQDPHEIIEILEQFSHLKRLNLNECNSLEHLDIGSLKHLESLRIHNCKKLKSISNSIGKLNHLKMLEMRNCLQFSSFSTTIENLSLQKLILNRVGKYKDVHFRDEKSIKDNMPKIIP